MGRMRVTGATLTLLFLGSAVALGQVLYGNLVGNVTDPQQAAIADAVVTIKSKTTGYSLETKTDDRGAYEFGNIPPGVYDVRVTATGFNSFEANEITIAANNIARLNAPLKIGNVSEVITISAESARLQTDKSDLHADIGARELTQINP